AKIMEFLAGTLIYAQGQSTIQGLSIILEGEAEKFFERPDGQKIHRESFGAGESFGAVSILLNNLKAIRAVRTLKESTILLIPTALFQKLCAERSSFYEFFLQEFGRRMLHSGYASELLKRPGVETDFQASDRVFQLRVGDLYSTHINYCHKGSSIQDAAIQMSDRRRSYIMVRAEDGRYVGIITDQMIRNEIVAKGKNLETKVEEVMRGPIYSIGENAFGYQAILLMFRRKVNYLLVKSQGKIAGLISLNRLLNSQGKNPFLFIQSIKNSDEVRFLQGKWNEVPEIVDKLLERGTRPEIVNQIVSSVSDAITQNIISRAIHKLGKPPVRFVFMVLGSEGRREQTLKTDQDNALIIEDVEGEKLEKAKEYFLKLGKEISDELNIAGFAYCEGNLMASNSVWNQPLKTWKEYYEGWISQPMGEKALIASVFFDAKGIYGDFSLMKELLSYVRGFMKQSGQAFLGQLARHSLVNRPPLGWFGILQETKTQDRKGINIKRAMQTITDFARIYALREQLPFTNTGERLLNLASNNVLTEQEFTELHQAYYFMMRLRLQHQTKLILDGQSPDNLIPVHELSKIEKVTLREIFKVIEKYQKRLSVVYLGY
ncbi:MAG: DUF294 nucleotidyltransferase-like domain-containing protein, partial [Bacteroidia bacterium]|nr:DUF294 nucleotidyltransferase-like domain-containing protein [Bacteroidia bacterium]